MIKFRAQVHGDDEWLAQRLEMILSGHGAYQKHPDKNQWGIGTANDWSLFPEGNEVYRLDYRYPDREKLTALATVLKWILGVTILEIS